MADKNQDIVVVRGVGLLQPPLLVTREAMAVEVYDPSGELVAVMHKVLDGHCWGVTTRKDDDWHEVLMQLGYINTSLDFDLAIKKKR